ncbi:MAG: shikimate dehydrogenase [Lachnospiraceae bacterium]|nr:shikimate dehydrogenase [Lachnospiraceae bacterium]
MTGHMEINGYTRVCGLIGNPVEHTMSPVIHNTLADIMGENLAYVPLHVGSGLVGDALKGAWALNFLGLNVTVPYKSEVIPYLADIDALAKRIGAVNTLVRTDNGFKGYNTDMPGLYRAMCEDGVNVEGEEVLLLGAGGVARAVAMLLCEKGAESIIILNRTEDRARKIADEVNGYAGRELVKALPLSEYGRIPDKKYLAIQATSVGMSPNTEEAVIEEEEFYKKLHTGYDLIFNPLETRFMRLVRAQGGRAFCGYKMLLYQGIIAYEYWTGRSVSDELAGRVYSEMLRKIKA